MTIRVEDEIMQVPKIAAVVAALLLGITASIPAQAHGGRHHYHRSHARIGIVIGAPLLWYHPSPVYYYPYRYYPGAVAVPAAPPVYIERGDAYTPPEQSPGYWYYCPAAQAYYPYVKQCAGGWQPVVPQPPPG